MTASCSFGVTRGRVDMYVVSISSVFVMGRSPKILLCKGIADS